jgi:hypothetical protein
MNMWRALGMTEARHPDSDAATWLRVAKHVLAVKLEIVTMTIVEARHAQRAVDT